MFGCFSFRKQYFLNGTIVNAASNILMLIIITSSMWYSRKDTTTSISIHAKTERRLIYQAIFSSFFLFICFALKFGSCLSFDMDIFYGFIYFSNIGYHIHHLVVMFSHFILSPSFKNAFCKFYRLNFLLVKPSKISGVSKPTPLKNITVLQKTI